MLQLQGTPLQTQKCPELVTLNILKQLKYNINMVAIYSA